MIKKITLSFICCLIASFAMAQTPDNSATVYISKITMRWGLSSLPITLVDFKGTLEGNKVALTWQTAMENNNSHFTIFRYTADNLTAVEIGRVESKGNSSSLKNYSFYDNQPVVGVSYYFLRQVDFNGKTSDSKVIAVDTGLAGTQFSVYQTAMGLCIAQVYTSSTNPASFYLTTVDGRVLNTVNTVLNEGANAVTLYSKPLAPGIYLVKMKFKNKQTAIKISIQ